MVENAFLDKGVLLGYCFFADPHHTVCREYLESNCRDYYTTKQIENIFSEKKAEIVRNHRSSILENIRTVKSNYDGSLSESDVEDIQNGVDRTDNDAWRYLVDFYDDAAGTSVYEVTEELRTVARDVETRAADRKEELYRRFQSWIRIASHEQVQEKLDSLRERDEEDFWVCIDAHDVAANVEGATELATNNPSDFAHEEIRSSILEHTAIDSIRLVFVSREYTPR